MKKYMQKYWKEWLIGSIAVICFGTPTVILLRLAFGGSSSPNGTTATSTSTISSNSSIDLSPSDQNFIMSQINTINPDDDVTESLANVNTASSIYFNYNSTTATDLINFIHSLGYNVGTAMSTRWGLYTNYAIPLSYVMVSSKTSADNPYQLNATIGIELDQTSINDVNKLLQNPDLIKKYNPVFNFDFATDGNTQFSLDNGILTNQRPLILDVTFVSKNGNSTWDSYSISIDPSNHLKSFNDDSDDSDDSDDDSGS